MPDFYSTREIADLFRLPIWRIQRLYSTGQIPEPPRFAGKRAIPAADIPLLVEQLRDRGLVLQSQPEAVP